MNTTTTINNNNDIEHSPLLGTSGSTSSNNTNNNNNNNNNTASSTGSYNKRALSLTQRTSSSIGTAIGSTVSDTDGYNTNISTTMDIIINNESSSDIVTKKQRMIQITIELFYGIAILALGWNIPRYYIHHETTISTKQPPYQKVGSNNNDVVLIDLSLNNPVVEPPTIPSKFLVYTSVHIPILFVAILAYVFHPMEEYVYNYYNNNNNNNSTTLRRIHKVCASVGALLTTIGISEFCTQVLKLFIQRKRPNYYNLCQFNYETLQCTQSNIHLLKEANFSFPSGHSSLSACSMIFITWFIVAKIHVYYQYLSIYYLTASTIPSSSSSIGKIRNRNNGTNNTIFNTIICTRIQQRMYITLVVCLLFPGWSIFVGATRLVDKWHHPSDVVAGLVLGTTVATIIYHIHFPTYHNTNNTNNGIATLPTSTSSVSSPSTTVVSIPYTVV